MMAIVNLLVTVLLRWAGTWMVLYNGEILVLGQFLKEVFVQISLCLDESVSIHILLLLWYYF